MQSFAWYGLQKDVREWTRCCITCQTTNRHNKGPIYTFDVPDARFHHVHIDLFGSLSSARGHHFLLTCVDRFTRWCEANPLIERRTVILAFLQNWIARFGAPKSVTTGRGPQFESMFCQTV